MGGKVDGSYWLYIGKQGGEAGTNYPPIRRGASVDSAASVFIPCKDFQSRHPCGDWEEWWKGTFNSSSGLSWWFSLRLEKRRIGRH